MEAIETIMAALSAVTPSPVTGSWTGDPNADHIVVTPLYETTTLEADNASTWVEDLADVHLYTAGNYIPLKKSVLAALSAAGLFIDDRRYIEYNTGTKLHHYAITAGMSRPDEED